MRLLVLPFPPVGPGLHRFPTFIGTMGSYDSSFALPSTVSGLPRLPGSSSTGCLFAPGPLHPYRPGPGPLLSGVPFPFFAGGDEEVSQVPGESLEACPGLETPAAPNNLALSVVRILPSARLTASASATIMISKLNPHGPLPCCLRFNPRPSPGERQGSLPACPLRL